MTGLLIFFGVLLIIYYDAAIYYVDHFYYGSMVNSIDVSGKTLEEVEKQMESELQAYTLKLEERYYRSEEIRGTEIGLKYSSREEVEDLKYSQKPFSWIGAFFNQEDSKITVGYSCREELLRKRLNELSCFDSSNVIEPKNPVFRYTGDGYMILSEVNGNEVDRDILYERVSNAIANKETTLNLDSVNCYRAPQYTSKSPEVFEVQKMLNKYVSSKITYTFGEHKVVVDGSTINNWLKVDENLQFVFDEEKVKEYLKEFSKTYNTVGKARNFVTSSGETIKVSGGDYGWLLDTDKETPELIEAVMMGQTMTKQPACIQTAQSHGFNDIGDTYVEIDLSGQHLWFYKDGSLITEGDVVTGNVSAGHSTPAGVYRLKYKKKGAVLRGPGYSAPVTFWMPFNGGIGIHDAGWRGRFGGRIYRSSGSHGCVNAPYSLAKKIFNNIEAGTPIVCYK